MEIRAAVIQGFRARSSINETSGIPSREHMLANCSNSESKPMPTHAAAPFLITPPADTLARHPHLKQLAGALSLKYIHHHVVSDDDLATVGAALWQALAAETGFEHDFDTALRDAGQRVLPIIIRSDRPALLALPWEALHHPQHGFLGRGKGFTISRRMPGNRASGARPGPPVNRPDKHGFLHRLKALVSRHSDRQPFLDATEPPPPKGPIRVLLFTSLPDDLDAERERLDVEAEEIDVLEALDPGIAEGWVDLTVPDDGRFERFRSLLDKQEFHLVFLSGHGVFREGNVRAGQPGAWFRFEGADGRAREVEAHDIAECFRGTGVRCVVLISCESGKGSSADLDAGLAAHLHGVGIPFVVGMRESVFDRAGTRFARAFCDAIGRRERVDVAVQAARRAIIRPFSDGEILRDGTTAGSAEVTPELTPELTHGQWCLPLLYGQQPDAPLVDWAFTPQAPARTARYRNSLAGIAVPRQFIGRRRELRELMQAMARGTRRLLITGPGGQGKTALAGRLARRLEDGGDTLIAWSARDPHEDSWQQFLGRVQLRFLDDPLRERVQREQGACHTPEETADVILGALLEATHGKLVLFLDNLETLQDPGTGALNHEGLTAWLVACGRLGKHGPRLLLTSRIALPSFRQGGMSGPSARDGKDPEMPGTGPFVHHPLAIPSYGDFLRYWQELAGESNRTGHRQPAWRRRLYRALGGNFKGLELFTHGLDSGVVADRAAEEEAFLRHLESATAELRAYMAVERVVGWLEPDAARLLERLTVYEHPVVDDGVQAVALDLADWVAGLQRLALLSLVDVEWDHDLELPRYRVPPLVADWLREAKGEPPLAIRERAARYQQWAFEHLDSSLNQALITHAALMAAELTEEAHVFALGAIVPWFDRVGMYRTLLADWLPGMRQSRVPGTRAAAMNGSGTSCLHLGDYGQALSYFTESLEITRDIGDRKGEGTTLNNLSQIHDARGDLDEALAYLSQSLAIQRDIGDRQGESTTLGNIGSIYLARGDYDQALNYFQQGLEITRDIGDRQGEGTTLNNISQIHEARGELDEALGYLTESLAIQRDIGDRQGEGVTLNNISQIHRARGEFDEALGYLGQSLAIQRDIGDRKGEGTTLNNISQIHQARGELDEALGYLTESLAIRRDIGDRQGESTTLGNIGNIHLARGDYDEALNYFQQDLEITRDIGDRQGEGTTLNNIAAIHHARGDLDKVLGYLTESLAIRRDIGDRAGVCATLFNIGHIHLERGEHRAALEKFVTAYRIAREIGLAQVLGALDKLAHGLGVVPEGEDGLAFWEGLAGKGE
uniref:ATP-, maltotriose- and DNA-dependent transcriptional regulator MalT n=1 Tax=Candidatus Kentrum sp. LFY TaxID=2126342 RepID=A0A450W9K4_9GAMM|nr:MAG: ATP-, maltotriose- and DNA-dependent transcriptional regulator MalT [Candidatus Kentron sp. LFY]